MPKAAQDGLSVDQVFEIERREGGVIELRPKMVIDPSQSWFWSPGWQQMEREADEDIAAGRAERFDNLEDFFSDFDAADVE